MKYAQQTQDGVWGESSLGTVSLQGQGAVQSHSGRTRCDLSPLPAAG